MARLQDILDRYNDLCDYCGAFWRSVFERLPARECACAAGCSTCCELSSVNFLEAYKIAAYCAQNPAVLSGSAREGHLPSPTNTAGPCPFLSDNRCKIYPARPLICRTHGLLLKSTEFADRITPSCPFNFATLDHTRADALALDIDAVTGGLARLNAAFCMLQGDLARAHERVALRDLASGTGSLHPWEPQP